MRVDGKVFVNCYAPQYVCTYNNVILLNDNVNIIKSIRFEIRSLDIDLPRIYG